MTWTVSLQQVQPPCRSLPLRSQGFLQCHPGSYDQWNPSIASLLVQK